MMGMVRRAGGGVRCAVLAAKLRWAAVPVPAAARDATQGGQEALRGAASGEGLLRGEWSPMSPSVAGPDLRWLQQERSFFEGRGCRACKGRVPRFPE